MSSCHARSGSGSLMCDAFYLLAASLTVVAGLLIGSMLSRWRLMRKLDEERREHRP